MSKEPHVQPYVLNSPPAFGATYQKETDDRPYLEQGRNGSNGHKPQDANGASASPSAPSQPESKSPAPASESPTRPRTGVFDQFWNRFRPIGASDEAPNGGGSATEESSAGVVYAITKKTDYWFDLEVFALERDARKEAADWAAQGLPRHDLVRVDPLEIELVLAGRSVELFRGWTGRVRTKVRDAINAEAEHIVNETSRLEAVSDRLGELRDTARRTEQEVTELTTKEHNEHPPIGYEPLVANRLFFPILAFLLIAVEFLANFPLFRLLLPLPSALAAAATEAALNVGDQWWAGLALWWKMSAWHVEAFVVSLAVVVVLVVFGKAMGSSTRLLTAIRAADHPLAGGSISSARRQAWAVVLACLLGSSLVVGALYQARSQIAIAAAERVATTSRNIDSLQAKIREARGDIGQVSSFTQRIRDAERTQVVHRDDYGYAQTVQGNNRAILFLNIGLVLAAALVGFLSSKFKLTNQFGADPRIADLKARRAQLDTDLRGQLSLGYESMAQSSAGIGRVEHLIRSSPLDQWPAKARRLSGIIPMFRADNARLRGLDSASILAFRQPPPLELPTFEAEQGFGEPADFAALKDRYLTARQQFNRLAGAAQ
ncbi:MAG: hypothetical protein ABIR92_04970 [Gemmatimonadaceae bacterium]